MSRDWSQAWTVVFALLALVLVAEPTSAHAGSLSGTYRSSPVPSWLVTLTGASIIGASFLFTSLFTDHAAIRAINRRGPRLSALPAIRTAVVWFAHAVGIAALLFVLAVGFAGPTSARGNAAVLFVWAGWWAGYTISVYLVANTWPLVNPWRTLGGLLPDGGLRSYPERWGTWPAVVGLLALVFVEVVSPVAAAPRWLATLVLGYSVVTLAGVLLFGQGSWFEHVDPVAAVFREYGRIAPIQRTGDGLSIRFPGTALTDGPTGTGTDRVAFVVALLWVTTFDGFVTTPAWASLAGSIVRAGVPALVVYLFALLAGFALFLGAYRLVSSWARRTADSFVTADFVAGWFAPSLLPIAAGYHLAHFLGYFLSLGPALVAVLDQPFSPPATVPVAVLPGWFGGLQLGFVVLGHLLAVWVAHALSFEVFTGRLQPLRSQYPFVLVMIAYTATSMWIIAQPYTQPPYL